jgi:hypothetical protein
VDRTVFRIETEIVYYIAYGRPRVCAVRTESDIPAQPAGETGASSGPF